MLKEYDLALSELLFDDLARFEHRHFIENFLVRIKKEIKLVVRHASQDYDYANASN